MARILSAERQNEQNSSQTTIWRKIVQNGLREKKKDGMCETLEGGLCRLSMMKLCVSG